MREKMEVFGEATGLLAGAHVTKNDIEASHVKRLVCFYKYFCYFHFGCSQTSNDCLL